MNAVPENGTTVGRSSRHVCTLLWLLFTPLAVAAELKPETTAS